LSCLNSQFPFSVAFGKADSRDGCVTSAFDVYRDLLTCSPEHTELNFDILALIAVEPDGLLNEAKLLEIVKLFRPDREGNLSLIDFVKSVDSVYKELRLLRASVASSSRIDGAFEKVINIGFYSSVGCIVLYAVGVDPFVLFGSVSAFVLAFAFMFRDAASKYFEGLLLILVRACLTYIPLC
jgi:small-conductance mechanosensitive channel